MLDTASHAEAAAWLEDTLGDQARHRPLWRAVRDRYAVRIAPLLDQELDKTFFNTLTRRFFRTRGVDAELEFIALDIEPTDRITHPVARHSHAIAGGTKWVMPMTPYVGLSVVHAGIRTPNVRTSTDSGVLTMRCVALRGITMRGLGHGLPFESSVCSHGRAVASGAPSMLKNTSGSSGWMTARSK